MARSSSDTRQRIVAAAYRLFYREGFQRAGVDEVAAEAGVTKRTLYNHFPSKDDLFAAVLTARARLSEDQIRLWQPNAPADAAGLIRHLFDGLRKWATSPRWRGSGFTRAAIELAWAPGHPARIVASNHKKKVEALLAAALAEAGSHDATALARQLTLLIEGAMALRLLHGEDGYLDAAETAALALAAREAGLSDPDGCA